MNAQVTQLLTQLAKTLGTTIEYLWTVELKQAYIVGFLDFVWVLLLIAFVIASYKLARWSYSKVIEIAGLNKGKIYSTDKIPSDGYVVVAVFSTLAIMVCFIFIGFDLSSGIGRLLNPQHYALENILSYVSGK